MFQVHCHVHESAVLLDWSHVEAVHDSAEGPVLDWRCWCGARGRLIAGTRSEPRTIEPVVIDLGVGDRPPASATRSRTATTGASTTDDRTEVGASR